MRHRLHHLRRSFDAIGRPEWLILALGGLGLLLCILSDTGFDFLGVAVYQTRLFTGFILATLIFSRLSVFLPHSWGSERFALRALHRFRKASPSEITALDLTVLRGLVITALTATVYINVERRIPFIHDNSYDQFFEELDTLYGAAELGSLFQSWVRDSDFWIRVLDLTYWYSPFAIFGLAALLYLNFRREHIRWLYTSSCFVCLLGVFWALAWPSLGPGFMNPASFEWLQGTFTHAFRVITWNLHNEAVEGASQTGVISIQPSMGSLTAFPSLRIGFLVAAILIALRSFPWYAAILLPVTALTGIAAVTFGLNYAVDLVAASLLAILVTEGLYRFSSIGEALHPPAGEETNNQSDSTSP